MGIREIEDAISRLSPEDLALFRQWYEEFDARNWDDQIEQDAKDGKLKKLADQATKEYEAGNFKEL